MFSAIVQDKRPFFTTFDYIVAVIQALQFVDYKDVLRFYFFNAILLEKQQLTNYKCSLIQYGDENDSEVLIQNFIASLSILCFLKKPSSEPCLHLFLLGPAIACLIKVLLYRRNVYNFVKRHLELIAIFLKKNSKKNENYVTRVIQSLSIHVIELLCYNWRFVNFWLEIWSHNCWKIEVYMHACHYNIIL